jgi:hypothetical protein
MSPDQLSEIAKQGLLGVLLFMAISAIIYLYRSCQTIQKDRMGDWKEISEVVKANSNSLRDWIAANEARTRAIEATARAQELTAQSATTLANEISALRDTINDKTTEAIASNRAMREALLRKGLEL